MSRTAAVIVFAGIVAAFPVAAQLVPLSGDLQVNTYTVDDQARASVTPAPGIELLVGDASGSPGEPVSITVRFVPAPDDGLPFGPDEINHLDLLLDFNGSPGLDFDGTDADGDGVPDSIVFDPDGNPSLAPFAVTVLGSDAPATRILRIAIAPASPGDHALPAATLITITLVVPADAPPGSTGRVNPVEVRPADLEGTIHPVERLVPGVVQVLAVPTATVQRPTPTADRGSRRRDDDDDGCHVTAPPHAPPATPLLVLPSLFFALRRRRRNRRP